MPTVEILTPHSFKPKHVLKDEELYAAIGAGVALWNETGNVYAAVALLVAWIIGRYNLRGKAVEAAGVFAATLPDALVVPDYIPEDDE